MDIKVTETTAPAPGYTIMVSYGNILTTGVCYAWSWKVKDSSGRTVASSSYKALFTRWGATREARRTVKRLVAQRTRTYDVTVGA